jgi:hypothetical protein
MGAAKAVTLFTGPLLLAQGRPMLPAILTWTLGGLTTAAIVVTGMMARDMAVGAQVTAVALARTSVFVAVYGVASVVLTRRACGLTVGGFSEAIVPGLVVGGMVIASGGLLGSSGAMCDMSAVAQLVLLSLTVVIVALVGLAVLDPTLRDYLMGRIQSNVRERRLKSGLSRTPAE